ncbi:MAG: biopolymer transporter ExbD, partial [Lentisphaerae bacterium]|nr:biopolymer transporter ExbD [Lentisphaerota bacterium]
MKPRSRRQLPSVPVASMGDIAFLLIIFFMVCSNPMKEQHIDLQPPRAEDLVDVKEENVSVSISAQGQIFVQGLVVADAEAAGWMVAALIADKVADGRTVMLK